MLKLNALTNGNGWAATSAGSSSRELLSIFPVDGAEKPRLHAAPAAPTALRLIIRRDRALASNKACRLADPSPSHFRFSFIPANRCTEQ